MRPRFAPRPADHAPRIRRAHNDDVEAMARVSVDTWRLAYGGILPAAYLERLNLGHQETQRRHMLASPDTAHFIAEEAITSEAVGFASCGASRGRPDLGVGEIYELYVQNGFQRQGLGEGLVQAAQAWMVQHGYRSMVVRVLAENPARGFYERLGGRASSFRTIRVGGAPVEEVAYVWDDLGTATG